MSGKRRGRAKSTRGSGGADGAIPSSLLVTKSKSNYKTKTASKSTRAPKKDAPKQSNAESGRKAPATPKRNKQTTARKRGAESDAPSNLTPSRVQPTTVPRIGDGSLRAQARLRSEEVFDPIPTAESSKAFIKDIKVSVSQKEKNAFFTIYLANYSVGNGTLKVGIVKHVWEAASRGEESWNCMMTKTREAIHNARVKHNIDLSTQKAKEYMDSDWPWKYLWAQVEKGMVELELISVQRANSTLKGFQTRENSLQSKEWTRGVGYTAAQKDVKAKSRAKASVLQELEKRCDKDLTKAEVVMSEIVSDLSSKHGLDENALQSAAVKERESLRKATINSASTVLKRLAKSVSISSLRLLTGVIAILLPLSQTFSIRKFCELLDINQYAKYIKAAIANRNRYNQFLTMTGPVQVGEKVICRGGTGILFEKDTDGAVTIKLLPWGNKKTYKTVKSAQMRRLEPSLDTYDRKQRFDTTPETHKKTIEDFFRNNVPQSPNRRDIIKIRHPVWPTQYKEARALHRYESFRELWLKFKKDYPDLYELYKYEKMPNTAPRIFRENAPFEMIKAPDQSCLCVNCEDMANLLRGSTAACNAIDAVLEKVKDRDDDAGLLNEVSHLKSIKNIISQPSKSDSMIACMEQCLPTGKLEDAAHACLYGDDCDKCGFRRFWSNGLRQSLVDGDDELMPEANMHCEEWTTATIDWRYFTHSISPTVAAHAQEVARQAANARSTSSDNVDADDDEYLPSQDNKPTRNLVLATKRGTLVDSLDEFEEKSMKHTIHRNIVAQEYNAKTNYEQNWRPLIVTRSIDFAENGTIKDKHQAQSQYWVSIQYTLFISIISWLSVDAWNTEAGILSVGDEVTVYGEKAGEKVNMTSFWGKISKVIDQTLGTYQLTDKNGNDHIVNRTDLRHRKKINIVSAHVTPDKKHDRHAMQHFTNNELKNLEELMNREYPSDIPGGKINRFHTHSDNAGQHFKSTGSMQYFTTLPEDREGTAFVYSFGAPNHGKCWNDGIGGMMKNYINSICESSMTSTTLHYTETGYIQSARDVYLSLHHHFGDDSNEERDRQVSQQNGIGHYRFFYYGPEDNPIQRPEETFRTLEGISQHYQFAVRASNLLYMRMRPCWCLNCMSALMEGTLEWGPSSHQVQGCTMVHTDENADAESSDDEIVDMFTFDRRHCTKKAGPGVAVNIANETRTRDISTMELTAGDWVLVDGDDEDEPIWLGRVMSNPEWGGQGVFKNETTRAKRYDNEVVLQRNNHGIYIMWYEKIDINSDALEYHVSRTITKPAVQSNEYMVFSGFEMHRVVGGSNPVPKRRNTNTARRGQYDRIREDIHKTFNEWHDKEFGLIWKMNDDVRRKALARCGMWR